MSHKSIIKEPVPISYIGGRYLLFDIDVVTYLRRVHHICGTLMGTLPQIPQQNLFLGLPVELMKEEVRTLVDRGHAHIVDDREWHKKYKNFQGNERKLYLDSIRTEGLKISQAAANVQQKRTQAVLGNVGKDVQKDNSFTKNLNSKDSGPKDVLTTAACETPETFMNDYRSRKVNISNNISKAIQPYAITPTISYSPSSLRSSISVNKIELPHSYHLYKDLYDRGYFILPGLRFGCNYNVYPGDPLRYHSHFIAVGYQWDQDIPVFDIVGGGRLGTAVKKGFLIGGLDPDFKDDEGGKKSHIRTFAIEWGGM
ncbi:tRNA-splicing endonuclease subunit sen34 [Blumeria hordei DH14]|uniref:tRNA-splicing endonuclease subunit Sen34 n=1 Tax=Blumeria graminis f. sp. hordei (strain DH14) TaxID=546991 RepID=N1JD37_BLUG1|nr:tRNA-splicing endonuclease subunit sen34 [Blumeria hordei DH14]